MATSQRRTQRRLSRLSCLSEERHASRFLFKESDVEWMTDAANCPCDSVRLWIAATRDGSYGRTSRTLLTSTEGRHLPQSFAGWMNSGISAHGECWTLNTSESPSDVAESFLSQVIDPGDMLVRSYLSRDQMKNMLRRLEKYGKENELTDALRNMLSDGAETKRQSMESR